MTEQADAMVAVLDVVPNFWSLGMPMGTPWPGILHGFRAADGWTLSVWSRNLLNKDYFDLLSAAPGNTGLYVGQPGDPRTFGVTMRVALRQ